jgi:hypothetical protein
MSTERPTSAEEARKELAELIELRKTLQDKRDEIIEWDTKIAQSFCSCEERQRLVGECTDLEDQLSDITLRIDTLMPIAQQTGTR